MNRRASAVLLSRSFLCLVVLCFSTEIRAQSSNAEAWRVDSNVVFGRYSGLALLMDVYRPRTPNGFGIVYVPGSGFHTPLGYDARPITVYTRPLVPMMTEAGYTVFVVNHRAAPRFRHPAAVEDVRRAVRFVRRHAQEYGIRPTPLAAAGYSSGGTLASLLGVQAGDGDQSATDSTEHHSARVQCVIAGGAAFDFTTIRTPVALPIIGSYLGSVITLGYGEDGPEHRLYREASPVTHVSSGSAPHLLIHGDADEILLFAQAESMAAALKSAGVRFTLLRVPGAGHGQMSVANGPDVRAEVTRFLEGCLATAQ